MSDKTARFFCPSYGISDENELQEAMRACTELSAQLGLICDPEKDALCLHKRQPQQWSQGPNAHELHKLFDCNVLWSVRGGYGSINWAADLHKQGAHCNKAPYLIGYSDISIWHAIWSLNDWGETCYGIMPRSAYGQRAIDTLLSCYNGHSWQIGQFNQLNHQESDQSAEQNMKQSTVIAQGTAQGPLQAYCLRILSSLCGTKFMPQLDDCILAIEDIDEKPYAVDRDLQQLYHAGCLDNIVALICGVFPCELEADYQGPSYHQVFSDWAQRLDIPVVCGIPFGHDPDPLCLPCGRLCTLDCLQDEILQNQWSLSFAARTT